MQFTLCTSLYALHSMHFTLCTSLYALHSMHFTLCTSLYALHSMHFTLCTSLYALHSMHFTLCASLCALHSVHLPLCTSLYALCSMRFTLCTSLYALHSMHFALCTSLYALHSMHFTLRTSLYALRSMHFTLCTSVYVVVSGGSARKNPSRCFREKSGLNLGPAKRIVVSAERGGEGGGNGTFCPFWGGWEKTDVKSGWGEGGGVSLKREFVKRCQDRGHTDVSQRSLSRQCGESFREALMHRCQLARI